MLPNDKIFEFLRTFSNLCENRTQHQFNIEFDGETYEVNGYYMPGFINNAIGNTEFYLWRGCVFAISYIYDSESPHFMLFWLGPKFVIDQNTGIELPDKYYDDIKQRLDIGF